MMCPGKAVGAATLLLLVAAIAGCTSSDHIVANRGDLLAAPNQMQTLGETLGEEQGEGGCLRAGRRGDGSCRDRIEDLAEVLGPPSIPASTPPSTPPPATPEIRR